MSKSSSSLRDSTLVLAILSTVVGCAASRTQREVPSCREVSRVSVLPWFDSTGHNDGWGRGVVAPGGHLYSVYHRLDDPQPSEFRIATLDSEGGLIAGPTIIDDDARRFVHWPSLDSTGDGFWFAVHIGDSVEGECWLEHRDGQTHALLERRRLEVPDDGGGLRSYPCESGRVVVRDGLAVVAVNERIFYGPDLSAMSVHDFEHPAGWLYMGVGEGGEVYLARPEAGIVMYELTGEGALRLWSQPVYPRPQGRVSDGEFVGWFRDTVNGEDVRLIRRVDAAGVETMREVVEPISELIGVDARDGEFIAAWADGDRDGSDLVHVIHSSDSRGTPLDLSQPPSDTVGVGWVHMTSASRALVMWRTITYPPADVVDEGNRYEDFISVVECGGEP